jgi:hypothetical protein
MLFLGACTSWVNPNQWAQEDLGYIRTTIRENHPGIYNELDPDFAKQMDHYYELAMQQLAHAHNDIDAVTILKAFIASFNDTHLNIHFSLQQNQISKGSHVREFKAEELCPGIHWITLPTFEPDKEQQKVLQQIIEQLPLWRSDDLLIFDIRGNSGGNTVWGHNIVTALFGNAYAPYHIEQSNAQVCVDWRASGGNALHLQKIKEENIDNFEHNSEFMQWLTHVIQGMQTALANKQPYFSETAIPDHGDVPHPIINPVHAKIMIIVDHAAVSAALDFIDDMKAMNHPVTLLGQTTKADSLYMDCRTFDLPSKKGKFCIPIKVYRNRVRGHNEPYVPDILWDDINDTDALKKELINYC